MDLDPRYQIGTYRNRVESRDVLATVVGGELLPGEPALGGYEIILIFYTPEEEDFLISPSLAREYFFLAGAFFPDG